MLAFAPSVNSTNNFSRDEPSHPAIPWKPPSLEKMLQRRGFNDTLEVNVNRAKAVYNFMGLEVLSVHCSSLRFTITDPFPQFLVCLFDRSSVYFVLPFHHFLSPLPFFLNIFVHFTSVSFCILFVSIFCLLKDTALFSLISTAVSSVDFWLHCG